jgi:hypothetical protein
MCFAYVCEVNFPPCTSRIQFRVLFPFLGQILQSKDRRHRANRDATTAVLSGCAGHESSPWWAELSFQLASLFGYFPLLNLQKGRPSADWGRMIFHVADVDAFWTHLKQKGFKPDSPQDAPGENGMSTCMIRIVTSCRLRDTLIVRIGEPSRQSLGRFG